MHVLHIISSSGLYGAERTLCNLFEHARGCDFTLALFSSAGSDNATLRSAVAKSGAKILLLRAGLRATIASTFHLLCHVRRERPDVLHAHGYKGLAAGIIVAACFGLPLVYTQHGFIRTSRKLRFYTKVDMLLCSLHRVFKIICVSEQIRNEYRKAGIDDSKLLFTPNAVPLPDKRAATPQPNKAEHDTTCLAVCRLSTEKGPDILLEAFALALRNHASTRLWFAGDGPMRAALMARAEALGITNRVHFWGHVDNVGDLLEAADIFVLPSLTEGTPMALLEAMAHELPSVCTSVGEVPRIVNASCGLLVPPGSAEELAEGLSNLLAAPSAVRRGMGQTARGVVAESYSITKHCQLITDIYAQAVAHNRAAQMPAGGR